MSVHLAHADASRLFGTACNHVPVPMKRLSGARLLWLNRRAMPGDPQFSAVGGDEDAYARHILDACAYEVDAASSLAPDALSTHLPIGFADRYGGAGIGHNGGSGRGINFNGYQIKGVGRTPLVSCLTKESHASGGAYLEECVRETIFSEVVAAEFPHGVIPTLAIIDTGLTQTWDTARGPKNERRTLLVRPCFLRPAHFERALGFVAGAPKEGIQDHARVVQVFGVAESIYGRSGLLQMYDDLWIKWARQLGYSFVHRLPHGSNTTSNISFDGRLVDFGATSAVPSWANTATSYFHHPFKDQFECIVRAIESLSYYFGRHLDPRLANENAIANAVASARKEYQQAVCCETLRLCGVPRSIANAAACEEQSGALWNVVSTVIAHYQVEQIDLVDAVPPLRLPWDLHCVWSYNVPRHLQALRSVLDNLVPPESRAATSFDCVSRAASRPSLYAPNAKASIYEALESDPPGCPAEDRARIAALIDEYIRCSYP